MQTEVKLRFLFQQEVKSGSPEESIKSQLKDLLDGEEYAEFLNKR